MAEAIAVPVHGHNAPPAPAGATQHSREVQATTLAGIPDIPAYATGASAPAAHAPTPQDHDTFLASQPTVAALDPRLTALLRGENPPSKPEADVPSEPTKDTKAETPDKVVEPETAQDKPTGGLNDIDLSSLENPQLENLGTLLLTAAPNLDIDRALGKAIEYMDPALIDEHYLREVGGDKAKVLVNLAEQIVSTAKELSDSTVKAVYEGAGGQENWNAAVALFNQKAPKHLREVAAELLDSKNANKIKSGAQFVLEYARMQGALADKPEYQDPAASKGNVAHALTKKQFQEELNKLVPEFRNPDYYAQRQELMDRRRLGQQLGI